MLTLLLLNPEQAFYQREIAEKLNLRLRAVQQVLPALVEAGIITREARGRQVYYRANRSCPIFPELRGIILKTVGLADVLREALAGFGDRIRVAFVFGSMADGTARSDSDVDLVVIGDVGLRELSPALQAAQQSLGREINPVTIGPREWCERVVSSEHFVSNVQQAPKIFVIGNQNELERLAGERETETP